MKEYKIYIFLAAIMFLGFNVGMIIFDYQHFYETHPFTKVVTVNIFSFMGILIHSCAIIGTMVFFYFHYNESSELEKDK